MKKPILWMLSALCAILLTAGSVQPGALQGQQVSSPPSQFQGVTTGMLGVVPDAADQYAQDNQARQGEALRSPAVITATPATMHEYMEAVLADVHNYWTPILTAAGHRAPQLAGYYFPMPGVSYRTSCLDQNRAPVITNDTSMLYCPADDSIYFSQAAAVDLWNGVVKVNGDPVAASEAGDFSVAYVLAHEYAHNVQMELGLLTAGYPVYKTELQADCLAGTWANSAYYAGYLEAGDIEEAQRTTLDIGDYGIDNPQHHGTPLQRNTAFMQGYNTGQPSQCDTWVLSNY